MILSMCLILIPPPPMLPLCLPQLAWKEKNDTFSIHYAWPIAAGFYNLTLLDFTDLQEREKSWGLPGSDNLCSEDATRNKDSQSCCKFVLFLFC